MRLIITKNYEELSKVAAEEFAKVIKEKPNAVLGLATGGSPAGMYKEIIKMYKNNEVDFSNVTTVNLDEYVGLNPEHEQSYRHFMNENLFNHVNINIQRTFVPNGLAEDLEEECKEYDNKIKELGGVDIQLLGVGNNGHIAFNEPDDTLSVGTSVVTLTQNTIEANARFFDNIVEVPRQAISMGLGGIMKAKKIVLIASGESKAEAIKGLISGKITTDNPATMLQMHRDVTIIVDKEAAKFIEA
ncbi:glucosamine-6-phosphate deaminase [Clostridium sp.]|jgi:glucosamine-6-phosphate deaminase|uniref:glucosamine-6-phosphate deaminase n=1 Tax=Clostridium sp. TaxID=1506 RepID=UPI0025C2E435|nr:glucosamine-6-phosphate deaminase [Clostridium sp.]MCI9303766.1 glucosamine-6-phosphate deaminase [Clostridium sp.]